MPLASETATQQNQPPNSPVLSSHKQNPGLEYADCVELSKALALLAQGDTEIWAALEEQDPENTNPCTRVDPNNPQMSIETAYSSVGPNEDSPGILPHQLKELHPDYSKGPWSFVHFFTKDILHEGFDLDKALCDCDITVNLVPHIVVHEDPGSYGLVVATSSLNLLSEKFPHFEVNTNYNPFKPAEADIRIHGLYEAKKRALSKALKEIDNGWANGTAECYRDTARKLGVGILWERLILNRDIYESNPKVREEMQDALSKSQLFAEASSLEIPDTLKWSGDMMFPDNYQDLPPQVLYGFGTQQVRSLSVRFEHTYRRLPSLKKPQNNKLLLSAWGYTYQGQELEVMRDWANSEEGLRLYEKSINDLRLQQILEDFTLTLLALLGRERLLPHTIDDTAQPVRGSYLTDFDAILSGEDISGRQTIFEQMGFSLMRVLHAMGRSEDLLQFLGEVLDKRPPLLTPLCGVSDQYCARKIQGDTHKTSFDKAKEDFSNSVTAMVESETKFDLDWTLIPRLPQR